MMEIIGILELGVEFENAFVAVKTLPTFQITPFVDHCLSSAKAVADIQCSNHKIDNMLPLPQLVVTKHEDGCALCLNNQGHRRAECATVDDERSADPVECARAPGTEPLQVSAIWWFDGWGHSGLFYDKDNWGRQNAPGSIVSF